MATVRKAVVRELASSAYELDAVVIQGRLSRSAADGQWWVGQTPLDQALQSLDGQEVYLLVVPLESEEPLQPKTCGICGDEYVGSECPHCRDVRRRLRGR
mgnify:CR=1 FL=1